jgi:hypothetical protein
VLVRRNAGALIWGIASAVPKPAMSVQTNAWPWLPEYFRNYAAIITENGFRK